MKVMAQKNIAVFLWVNFFATWFVGGGGLMLYPGADASFGTGLRAYAITGVFMVATGGVALWV
jgi:bacteriorhodopsin